MFDRYQLSAEIHRAGYTQAEAAHKIGIAPSTMSRKMNSGDWTAAEMYALVDLLKIANPETIFFAQAVAKTATNKGGT